MNVGMYRQQPTLALYVTENALGAFSGLQANNSLPIYHHVRGNTIAEKQDKIRKLLQHTIPTDRLIFSPDFFTPIFRQGMNKLLVKDSDSDYLGAFFMVDSGLDCDMIQHVDIRGPLRDNYFLFLSKFHNLREAKLEPASLLTDSFFYFLKEHDLCKLHINCVMDECIFKYLNEGNHSFHKLQDVLQVHCTSLRVLSLRCTCREHENEMGHIAKLARQLTHVENICIAASFKATTELILKLQDLLDLGISLKFDLYMSHGEFRREVLRPHIDLIKSVVVKHADKREILDLLVFEKLEALEVDLINGGETNLIAVPPENIHTLRIAASPMAGVGNGLSYYEPSENTMLVAVNRMMKLKNLALINCRITKTEIYKIMENVANNLESLEMSILDQEECPSQRLLDICIANIKFNRNIRKLKVRDDVEEDFAKALKWGSETFQTYLSLYRKLIHTRELLTCVAPMLDPWHLTHAIQSLVPRPNIIAEVQESFSYLYASSSVTSNED